MITCVPFPFFFLTYVNPNRVLPGTKPFLKPWWMNRVACYSGTLPDNSSRWQWITDLLDDFASTTQELAWPSANTGDSKANHQQIEKNGASGRWLKHYERMASPDHSRLKWNSYPHQCLSPNIWLEEPGHAHRTKLGLESPHGGGKSVCYDGRSLLCFDDWYPRFSSLWLQDLRTSQLAM